MQTAVALRCAPLWHSAVQCCTACMQGRMCTVAANSAADELPVTAADEAKQDGDAPETAQMDWSDDCKVHFTMRVQCNLHESESGSNSSRATSTSHKPTHLLTVFTADDSPAGSKPRIKHASADLHAGGATCCAQVLLQHCQEAGHTSHRCLSAGSTCAFEAYVDGDSVDVVTLNCKCSAIPELQFSALQRGSCIARL